MNKLTKTIITALSTLLLPIAVYAVQITVPSAPSAGYWLISTTTGAYIATTTSPLQAGWFTATSTTATSTFSNGINLNNKGCFSVLGTCIPANATSSNYWYPSGNNIYNANSGNVTIGALSAGLGKLEITTTGTTPAIFTILPTNANATILQTGASEAYGWKFLEDEVTTGDMFIKSRAASVDSTNPVMYFQRSMGFVGLGTASPDTNLTLQVSSGSNIISYKDTAGTSKAYVGIANATNALIIGSAAGDYGIRSNGGNILLSTDSGSSAQMYISSAGNVGIGDTTPTSPLTVTGNAEISGTLYDPGIRVTTLSDYSGACANSCISFGGASKYIEFETNNVENMRIINGGNVGIGTTSPVQLLSLQATAPQITLQTSSNGGRGINIGLPDSANGILNAFGGGYTILQNQGTNALAVYNGGTAIGSYAAVNIPPTNGLIVSGSVGVATTSPWRTLAVTGTVGFDGLTASAGLQVGILCLSANKEVINESVACVASAERYKENIKPLTTGLDTLMKLEPVSFTWKPEYNGALQTNPNFNGTQYSLIADDVQKVDPHLVTVTTATTTFEGKVYPPGSVDGLASTNAWVGLLVKSIQEQQLQIDQLKAEIKELKK